MYKSGDIQSCSKVVYEVVPEVFVTIPSFVRLFVAQTISSGFVAEAMMPHTPARPVMRARPATRPTCTVSEKRFPNGVSTRGLTRTTTGDGNGNGEDEDNDDDDDDDDDEDGEVVVIVEGVEEGWLRDSDAPSCACLSGCDTLKGAATSTSENDLEVASAEGDDDEDDDEKAAVLAASRLSSSAISWRYLRCHASEEYCRRAGVRKAT